MRYNCGYGYARIKFQYSRQGIYEKAFRDRGSKFIIFNLMNLNK